MVGKEKQETKVVLNSCHGRNRVRKKQAKRSVKQ